MELPLYHLPNLRTIGIYIRDNILGFLKKAGTTILVATLVVWALSYFPSGNVLTSYLGMVGKFLEPVGKWMGLPWPVLVALLTSFIAKENTVATLGVLYGNLNVLKSVMTPAAMLAFLVFQILFIPCVGTVAAIQQETKSWKWTAHQRGHAAGLEPRPGCRCFSDWQALLKCCTDFLIRSRPVTCKACWRLPASWTSLRAWFFKWPTI